MNARKNLRGGIGTVLVCAALALGGAGQMAAHGGDAAGAESAVFAAVMDGDTVRLEALLAAGADINQRDKTGQTPLITAALAGRSRVTASLLDHGADVMARTDKGMTALHAAAFSGDLASIELLIGKGAAVNDQANFAGITPLHAAANENRLEVIEALMKAGADAALVENNNYTASTMAGWRQNWDVVEALVKLGDVCQPAAIAGDWVFKKCASFGS